MIYFCLGVSVGALFYGLAGGFVFNAMLYRNYPENVPYPFWESRINIIVYPFKVYAQLAGRQE